MVWQNPELRELKSKQTTELNKLGITGTKGKSTKKKGKPFSGDKQKLSDSLKSYYKDITSPKAFNPLDIENRIYEYSNTTIPIIELAAKYNVMRTTITALMKRKGVKLRRDGSKEISKNVLFDLRINNSLSVKEIANSLKCSVAQVEKYITKYKIYIKCQSRA